MPALKPNCIFILRLHKYNNYYNNTKYWICIYETED